MNDQKLATSIEQESIIQPRVDWNILSRQDSSVASGSPSACTYEAKKSEAVRSHSAIKVQNLSKYYGDFCAVNNISFVVPQGSTIGLLGGNGAGKTTTIAMIMGLITPSLGRVSVLGHDMAQGRHRVLKRMNFQSPYVAMPAQLSVWENLNVFGRLYGVKDTKARIAKLADEFGLSEVLHLESGRLSAGQKTRVSLAKALINDPEVLLLDEPTASLDPDRAVWVRQLLQTYQKEHKATILISSHNMLEVEQMCDFVMIMSYGRMIEIGTPLELMNLYECKNIEQVFLSIMRNAENWGYGEAPL